MSDRGDNDTTQRSHHIVVGYTHEGDCDHALDRALELAVQFPSTVIHVVRAVDLDEDAEIDALDAAFGRAREQTIDAVTRACERGTPPLEPLRVDISFGDPAEVIDAAARRVAASLVIIGHGSDGTVARELSRCLRCALLVASADRYSDPEPTPRVEVAKPDDPERKPHVYHYDNVFEHYIHHIGATRIY